MCYKVPWRMQPGTDLSSSIAHSGTVIIHVSQNGNILLPYDLSKINL